MSNKDLSWVKLPPHQAISYLQSKKKYRLSFHYDELMHEAHHKAFTVAKISKVDLLSDIHQALVSSMEEGVPYASFKKKIHPILVKKGWWGKVEAVSSTTGEVEEIFVGDRRLKNIFYTNMRTSYMAGRAKTLYEDKGVSHLRYVAILDNRTRHTHASMHNKVLPKHHPFWEENFPPNGWHCRCRVSPVTQSRLSAASEEDIIAQETTVPTIASKDWAYDVRTGGSDKMKRLLQQRSQAAPAPLKESLAKEISAEAVHVRTQQLEEMVEEVIVKGNQKYPISVIEVGSLSTRVLSAIAALLKKEAEVKGVVLEKNQLLHARPERKASYGQALRAEEFKQIVDVLEKEKDVYIETKPSREAVIYLFEDTHDPEKTNKIVVNINKRVKKFDTVNAIITLSKIKKRNFEKDIEGGVYTKVK